MELRNNGLLEKHVVDVLKEKKLTVTTAESCTGGMISSRIVNVPGASAVLKQAYVTYCDEAKHTVLGVKKEKVLVLGLKRFRPPSSVPIHRIPWLS